MWLLFHRNAKTRPVKNGERFVETCPECGERATFVEVELSESYGLFFVDIVGDKERAFRCGACGETFDLKDREAAAPAKTREPERSERAASRSKTLAELEREQAIERERRNQAAAAKAIRIDDELAELKKRMGRS